MIKKTSDFILGILMICVGLFLLLSDNIVANMSTTNTMGGYFARPDVYIRMLALILMLTSVILVIKSLNFFGKNKASANKTEKIKFHFSINDTICCIILSMTIYTIVLPLIGFEISTFLILFYLSALFSIKEQNKKLSECTKQEFKKVGISSLIYSVISVVALYFVFTKGLGVQLP